MIISLSRPERIIMAAGELARILLISTRYHWNSAVATDVE